MDVADQIASDRIVTLLFPYVGEGFTFDLPLFNDLFVGVVTAVGIHKQNAILGQCLAGTGEILFELLAAKGVVKEENTGIEARLKDRKVRLEDCPYGILKVVVPGDRSIKLCLEPTSQQT